MWPLITYWPGIVHDVVGITGDPRILILGGLSPFECSLPARSRALRGGQLGSSEWGTLRWIIKYLIRDLLLATSWAAPRRLDLLETKNNPLYEAIHLKRSVKTRERSVEQEGRSKDTN